MAAGGGSAGPGETIERLKLREEVKEEVMAELAPPILAERLEELNRAKMAWLISRAVFLLITVPIGLAVLGASGGAAVRLFLWCAFR